MRQRMRAAPLLTLLLAFASCGCSGKVRSSCAVASAPPANPTTVQGTAGPIDVHVASQAASDFGSGIGSGGFYLFLASHGDACLTLDQVRRPNGRTVLWVEWADDHPRSVSVGGQNVSVQLVVEDGSNNYAAPTGGSVNVSRFGGGTIAGSYDLTFGTDAVTGDFNAPVCSPACQP